MDDLGVFPYFWFNTQSTIDPVWPPGFWKGLHYLPVKLSRSTLSRVDPSPNDPGVIKWDPSWWNQTWYKSMAILRDFPWITMHEVWVGNIMSPASPKGCMVDIKSSISNAGHINHCLLECMLDGSGYGADGGPLLEIFSFPRGREVSGV